MKKKAKTSKPKAKTSVKKKAKSRKKSSFNPRIVSAELVKEGVFEIVIDIG